jgi:hypothetical protein
MAEVTGTQRWRKGIGAISGLLAKLKGVSIVGVLPNSAIKKEFGTSLTEWAGLALIMLVMPT